MMYIYIYEQSLYYVHDPTSAFLIINGDAGRCVYCFFFLFLFPFQSLITRRLFIYYGIRPSPEP